MNKNWFKKRLKYFLVLLLDAIIAFLLIFEGTRQILYGLFGYAVYAYLIAIAVATLLFLFGRIVEVKPSRMLLYFGLFFAFLATLHVGLSKPMTENFTSYIVGTFEVATPGGIIVASVTSVFAVTIGYLPALIIFFVLTAVLGFLAILPFLTIKGDAKKEKRVIKKVAQQQLPAAERPMIAMPLEDTSRAIFAKETEPMYYDVEPEAPPSEAETAYGALFGGKEPTKKEEKKRVVEEPITERGSVIPGATDLKTAYYTTNSFQEIKRKKMSGALGILEANPEEYYEMKYGMGTTESKVQKAEEPVFTTPTKPISQDRNTEGMANYRKDSKIAEKEVAFMDEEEDKDAYQAPKREGKAAVGFERPKMVSQETLKPIDEKKGNALVYRAKPYKAPPIELLDPDTEVADGEIEDYSSRKEIIEKTIREFGIDGMVVNAIKGPAVTRYELRLAPGTNVKKINGVKDNLMMDLSVSNISILAPIPGKPLVGIELPNFKRTKVSFRSMMNSPEFNKKEGKLVFAIGKTVDNRSYSFDMVDAPHMMVAGTTGSGKSVCINVFLMSLLYRYSPEDVRLILIDPKRVEMKLYHEIPHLLIAEPIVEVPEAINVLKWACGEMDRRYAFLENHNTKDIDNYNRFCRKETEPKMYRIVIVIDEMADLMMRAKGQAEESIVRIAQLGRAAGIHLVLATQRPVATIITGLIKSNVPTCICCTTKTNLESRIVMDDSGAENLLGKGDLYFVTAKESDKIRMQSAFVDEPEIKRVCDYVRQNNDSYFDATIKESVKVREVIDVDEAQEKLSQQDESERRDNAILRRVMVTFILSQKASVSLAQKKHTIGYMRAARIVDQLEQMGLISPEDGKNPRKVLISMQELDQLFPLADGDEKEFS